MLSMIEAGNVALLCRMIVGHILVDFILQTDSFVGQRVERKWASWWLYAHGLFAGLSVYLFAGQWNSLWVFGVVAASHIAVDGLKSMTRASLGALLLDQGAHLAVILACWSVLAGLHGGLAGHALAGLFVNPGVWIVVVAYAGVIWPGAVVVDHIAGSWARDKTYEDSVGLPKAGTLIGRLERVLILTFVLCHEYEAVGFLVAAKSIFRFGGGDAANARKETEYFLVGTLASLVIAIFFGLLANMALEVIGS